MAAAPTVQPANEALPASGEQLPARPDCIRPQPAAARYPALTYILQIRIRIYRPKFDASMFDYLMLLTTSNRQKLSKL